MLHSPYFDAMFLALTTQHVDDKDRQAFMENPIPQLQKIGIPLLPSATMDPVQHHMHFEAAGSVGQQHGIDHRSGFTLGRGKSLSAAANTGEVVKASTHWWGVDIYMNDKMTQDIIMGTEGAGAAGGAITAALVAGTSLGGPIGAAVGAGIGLVAVLKIAEIKIAENGNGVHWPISWLQWAALAATAPGGPPRGVCGGCFGPASTAQLSHLPAAVSGERLTRFRRTFSDLRGVNIVGCGPPAMTCRSSTCGAMPTLPTLAAYNREKPNDPDPQDVRGRVCAYGNQRVGRAG